MTFGLDQLHIPMLRYSVTPSILLKRYIEKREGGHRERERGRETERERGREGEGERETTHQFSLAVGMHQWLWW